MASRILAGAFVAAALAAASPAVAATPAENRAAVLDFMETLFNRREVATAFERHVGSRYIQHNPRVSDGREAAQRGLGLLLQNNPQLRVEVKRAAAEGDLVFVHFHQIKSPGVLGEAIVDIFRLEDGKIVEHWDVVEPVVPPDQVRNPNTMF